MPLRTLCLRHIRRSELDGGSQLSAAKGATSQNRCSLPHVRPYRETPTVAFDQVEQADGSSVLIGIWDTAGAERFDSLSSFYCRGARAAICCYDISDKESFTSLSTRWIRKVIEQGDESCHIILCGTKGARPLTDPMPSRARRDAPTSRSAGRRAVLVPGTDRPAH